MITKYIRLANSSFFPSEIPIKDGDNEQSRLSGIVSNGEFDSKDVIREREYNGMCGKRKI